jgi:hypothetical protein
MYRRTHAASHFGKKVVIDGLKFDSMKEASFVRRFIRATLSYMTKSGQSNTCMTSRMVIQSTP